MKKKAAKKTAKKTAPKRPRRSRAVVLGPKDVRLPGIPQDPANAQLEAFAVEHDEALAIAKNAKGKALMVMNRLGKTHYSRGRFKLTVTETESIRITVTKTPAPKDKAKE